MPRLSATLLTVFLLAGCSTSGLLPSASELSGSDSELSLSSSSYDGLQQRGTAPYTQTRSASPGSALLGPQGSTSSGRSGNYVSRSMTLPVTGGNVTLSCRTIAPTSIRGIPQRYSNDCAQAAIAMTLDYLGVSFGGASPYEAVAQAMPPMSWGTRIEDVSAFLGTVDGIAVNPVRQATLEYVEGLNTQGKAVPVILTLNGTSMHYVVVIGRGESRDGRRYVLLKDPAQPESSVIGVLEEETFLGAWENGTLRNPLWSWFASWVSSTNASNYERIAFDIGLQGND